MVNDTQQIPVGYKQTDVGVIPNDWNDFLLRQITDRISVGLATSVTKYYRKNGTPIIRNLNIKDGYFDGKDMLYLDEKFAKLNASKAARALDVLTVHTGSNLGQTCVLPKEFDNCQTFTTLITTPKKHQLNSFYLSYFMSSFYGRKEMSKLQVGGGKGNLNTGHLKLFRIFIPLDINEQKKIVASLLDIDSLISKLDQLIQKKKNIKQGAMQELLTGKRRLPGFSGEWENIRLGDLLQYEQPTKYIVSNTDYSDTTGVPVLTAGKSFILGYSDDDEGFFEKLPVIIFDDFTTDSKFVDFVFKVKSSAMKMLHPKTNGVDLRFVFEKMQLIDFPLGDHKRRWISEYQEIELSMPKYNEQCAITKILENMSAEISSLELQKNKYQYLKQGMMQQLLTGKIRLI